ncbi:MAG: Tyrosine recombinase XerC [Syntrophorhabdus sp. PtaU1.Bin153]|nr:MAG: Tyrosine recombinase XerC [Syntrophorhabdus sp. PtaU1.Bin153]
MFMLRCGLRVEEVSRLTIDAVELPRNRLFVANGKGRKDRVVYLSKDAKFALENYLEVRSSKAGRMFLVQKGPLAGTPIPVRGIRKRIEYYARQSTVKVSCHSLRHTMATQLLNADADPATFQFVNPGDLQEDFGRNIIHITTTQRYCRVSNLKVQRDYYNAIEVVMQRSQAGCGDGWLPQKRLNVADDHMLYLQEEVAVSETKTDKKENRVYVTNIKRKGRICYV